MATRIGLTCSHPHTAEDVIKAVLVLADLGEAIVAVLIDFKKAHLNGWVKPQGGDHFMKMPEEMVGKLKRWLHSMKLAARAWEED